MELQVPRVSTGSLRAAPAGPSEMATGAQESFEAPALHTSAAAWPHSEVCRSQA